MKEKANDDYENFRKLADASISRGLSMSKPSNFERHKTVEQLALESDSIILESASFYIMEAVIAASYSVLRDLIVSVEASNTALGRKKHHIMDDYISRNKRVSVLTAKINRLIFKYYEDVARELEKASRTDVNGFDYFESNARLSDAGLKHATLFISRIVDIVNAESRRIYKPIDPVMMAKCFSAICLNEMCRNTFSVVKRNIKNETRKNYLVFDEISKSLIELMDLMKIESRAGKHYRWLPSVNARKDWRDFLSTGKKHYKGCKVDSIQIVDTFAMLNLPDVHKVCYEMARDFFSIDTISELASAADVICIDMKKHTRLKTLLKCSGTFEQYMIFVTCTSYDFDGALEYLYALDDSIKESFVASYSIDDKVAKFNGIWFSASDAELDCGTDCLQIVDIAAANQTPFRESTSVEVDKYGNAFFDYWMFVDDLEYTLSISENLRRLRIDYAPIAI